MNKTYRDRLDPAEHDIFLRLQERKPKKNKSYWRDRQARKDQPESCIGTHWFDNPQPCFQNFTFNPDFQTGVLSKTLNTKVPQSPNFWEYGVYLENFFISNFFLMKKSTNAVWPNPFGSPQTDLSTQKAKKLKNVVSYADPILTVQFVYGSWFSLTIYSITIQNYNLTRL